MQAHSKSPAFPYRVLRFFFLATLFIFLFIAPESSAQDSDNTLSVAWSSTGIPTLVGPNGHTLYTFAHDEDGESVCENQCAQNWPPLILDEGTEPVIGTGVVGEVGTIQRTDGSTQVTYDGWPLYYFIQDLAPGDAVGQGIRDVWFAANPATVMLREQPGVGNILVGPSGLSLYVFLKDEIEDGEGESYCFDECEVAWPPLIVSEGMEASMGEGLSGELGIHEREDGSRQVTYNGWPLYYFKMDRQPGDITGNGMKDVWYLALADTPAASEERSVNLELVAEGLTAPVAFAAANGQRFIVDQAGSIRILSADGQLVPEPFLDLSDKIVELTPDYDERGVLGLAFHPDYANNGRFYVYYTAPLRPEAPADWDHTNVIAEYQLPADSQTADPNSERIIWMLDQPQFNHNSGHIAFGPDGYLYIPIGDGGGGNDTGLGHTEGIGNAQDTTNLHGSILRIDVDGGDPYGIPADNPFAADDDNIANEIYAYGLRNPYHISFDSEGQLFVADAGQELYEEVSIVTAGGNYGWNIKEASHCFDPNNPTVPPSECADTGANGEALIDPVIEYDHSRGVVVVGGYVVGSSSLSELNGLYLFGSYTLTFTPPDGRLFAAEVGSSDTAWDLTELNVVNREEDRLGAYLLAFGMDEAGEIYVLTSENLGPTGNTGKVWRLTSGNEDTDAEATEESEMQAEETAAPLPVTTEETTEEANEETGQNTGSGMVSAGYTNNGIPTLTDENGLSLYTFAFDHDGESTCYDSCAEEWPPLLLEAGSEPSSSDELAGELSTVERQDGSRQATYRGWPLYYYHDDAAAGDAEGQGIDDVWFAANPADIMLSPNGLYLVGAGGFTLYIFTEDRTDESYCFDECTVAWPPLIVPEGFEPSLGAGISGDIGVFQRPDGQMQLSYNGWPLYFFRADTNPGDAVGDGAKDVWFVATPNRSPLGLENSSGSEATAAPGEATAEVTPGSTAETTTEATPEVTPEITPEVTTEVTPETTSTP
jgi:predicted lipoprotein with Yx(FWY)xxD motif/glucose/arabinose dehydrogenase